MKRFKTKLKTFIKFVLLIVIVVWVYGLFYYESSKSVEDTCKNNLSINNCYIISTDK